MMFLLSAVGVYYYYHFAAAQTATFGLAVLLLLGIAIFIALVVTLCKKPPPEDFLDDGTGNIFQTAFRQSYASRERKKESFV